MLQKEKSRFAGFDVEVLLHFFSFLSAKWWIGKNYMVTVFFLNISNILCQRIGMNDIRGLNAVQNHVHHTNDVSQILFLLSVKCVFL